MPPAVVLAAGILILTGSEDPAPGVKVNVRSALLRGVLVVEPVRQIALSFGQACHSNAVRTGTGRGTGCDVDGRGLTVSGGQRFKVTLIFDVHQRCIETVQDKLNGRVTRNSAFSFGDFFYL